MKKINCIINFPDPSVVYKINSPLILEASAGSGKTTVLVERWIAIFVYLTVIENISVMEAVRSIVAITFTRKAAAEMKGRIRQKIEACFDTEYLRMVVDNLCLYNTEISISDSAIKTGIYGLLAEHHKIFNALASAPISTIHSFGLGILRSYPIETKIDPAATPGNEEDIRGLSITLNDTIFTTFRAMIDEQPSPNSHLKFLVGHFGYKWLRDKVELLFRKLSEIGIEKFETAAKNSGYLDLGEDVLKTVIDDKILPLIEETLDLLAEAKKTGKMKILEKNLETVKKSSNKIDKGLFSQKLEYKTEYLKNQTELDFREQISAKTKSINFILHQIIFPHLFVVLQKCHFIYEKLKHERKEITFSDIEAKLETALRTNNKFCQRIQEKYRYIMIDEYQDTSDIQKSIFDMIILNSSTNKAIVPFIVGDVKQSIFRFRNADYNVFINTREEFLKRYGNASVKYLEVNYRSVGKIVESVNNIFGDIMGGTGAAGAIVSYSKQRPNSDDGEALDGVYFIEAKGDKIDDIISDGVETISQIIKNLLENNKFQPRDIMILFSTKKRVSLLNKALDKNLPNVPYVNIDKINIVEEPEIQNIIIYLKALDNPNSDYYFLPVLKTPFFCKDDNDIIKLAAVRDDSKKEAFSLYQAMMDSEPKNASLKLFNEIRAKKNKYNIPDLVGYVLKQTGYIAFLNTIGENSKSAITNTLVFQDKLRSIQNIKMFNLTDFLYYIETNSLDIGNPKVVGEKSNVIRILTVHSAKGLEASVVFYVISATDYQRHSRSDFYINDIHCKPHIGLKLFGKDKKYQKMLDIEKSEDFEEQKRLCYVAMTRAKKRFYYIGAGNKKDSWYGVFEKTNNFEISADYTELLDKSENIRSDTAPSKPLNIDERINYLAEKETPIFYYRYPETITITQLLDIEFEEAAFRNKYITKSYPLDQALIDIVGDDSISPSKNFRADKGTFIHKVFQFADKSSYIDYVEHSIVNEDTAIIKDKSELLADIKNFYDGSFYCKYYQDSDIIYQQEELEVNFPIEVNDKTFLIKGAIDKYIQYSNSGVLIDYKLSIAKDKEPARYARQLNYYAAILQKIGYPVKELFLYDIEAGCEVAIGMDTDIARHKLTENIRKILEQFEET